MHRVAVQCSAVLHSAWTLHCTALHFGGPLHEAGEAGRGVLLHDDEEAGEAALGGLGDTGTCHIS